MTGKTSLVALCLPVLALLGCGPARAAATTPLPTLCPPISPVNDTGLSDMAHDAECNSIWVSHLNPSTINWSGLARTESAFDVGGPPDSTTFDGAVNDAGLIITGTVQSLSPAVGGTDTTITVSRVFKGQAGQTFTVRQGSYLEPDPPGNWSVTTGMVIATSNSDRLLLPGETVFLFLRVYNGSSGWLIEPMTGTYSVQATKVQALPSNPFADTVNGMSAIDFSALIQKVSAVTPQPASSLISDCALASSRQLLCSLSAASTNQTPCVITQIGGPSTCWGIEVPALSS